MTATILPTMKCFRNFGLIVILGGGVLASAGTGDAATAPLRVERREQAEAAFKRLAALNPDQIATFLDHRMVAQLDLSDVERPRVAAINLDYAHRLREIAASPGSVRAKARALKRENDDHEDELKEVLTAAQFSQFLAMKEGMREALKEIRSDQ